jgi:hypothetical protein
MLTVTHFTETLLEAVEEELKVRATLSYPYTALNPSSSLSIGLPS